MHRESGPVITVGLTGSIGMGKSTVARMFEDLGAARWDADEAVHQLYRKDGAAFAPLIARFPGTDDQDGINRGALSARVLNDPQAFADLEAIVHPLVAADRAHALQAAKAMGAALFVVDMPLLFETGSDDQFDVIVVVSAPPEIQERRVLARSGMTREKFEAIIARQMPDNEKRARADFTIRTDGSLEETQRRVAEIYHHIRQSERG